MVSLLWSPVLRVCLSAFVIFWVKDDPLFPIVHSIRSGIFIEGRHMHDDRPLSTSGRLRCNLEQEEHANFHSIGVLRCRTYQAATAIMVRGAVTEDRCGVSFLSQLKHQVEELIDAACLPSQRFTKDGDRTGSIGRAGGRWQQYIPACSFFSI